MKNINISFGFYPGILFGVRTYKNSFSVSHVFYLPLIDLCINVYNERRNSTKNKKQS